MPDTIEAPSTTLQADIAAKTKAAVQDTGLGVDFDKEVESAISKDNEARAVKEGKKPADAKPPEVKAPEAKPAETKPEKPSAPVLDIPEALLEGVKPPVTKDTTEAAAARQKEIEEATKGMSAKASQRFKKLEAERAEFEQRATRAADLEKKLADAENRLKTMASNSESEALKKQVEELDAVVQKVALTEHPKFRAAFDLKIEQEIVGAAKFVKKEDAAEVQALLSLPESAQRNRRLNEIVGELETIEAGKFQSAVDRVDRLTAERAHELANWKANKQVMAQMTEAEQKQTLEQRQRLIDNAYKAVETKFSDPEKGIELFRRVEGNDEWNRAVDARLAHVRKLTESELRPDDIAEMAAWAMSGNEYRKMFLSQRVLVKRLQEEIQALKGGEPGLGEAGGHGGEDDESGSMIDVVSRAAQRAGAVR